MNNNKTVEEYINNFVAGGGNQGIDITDKVMSFDFCYNYFQSFYKENRLEDLASDDNLEKSCLHIGFYLASWGMLRGSSFLFKKSIAIYIPLIYYIANSSSNIWEIDIDQYTDENIDLLLQVKNDIIDCFPENNTPSDTLITKIMLGVFGNVPAFDTYLSIGLGLNSFNKQNLLKAYNIYNQVKNDIDNICIYSTDFLKNTNTDILYPKVKIFDMYGFQKGYEKDNSM